jgi:hypothetical protein
LRNEGFRGSGLNPLKSLGCEIVHFAASHLFNGLAAIWFRDIVAARAFCPDVLLSLISHRFEFSVFCKENS